MHKAKKWVFPIVLILITVIAGIAIDSWYNNRPEDSLAQTEESSKEILRQHARESMLGMAYKNRLPNLLEDVEKIKDEVKNLEFHPLFEKIESEHLTNIDDLTELLTTLQKHNTKLNEHSTRVLASKTCQTKDCATAKTIQEHSSQTQELILYTKIGQRSILSLAVHLEAAPYNEWTSALEKNLNCAETITQTVACWDLLLLIEHTQAIKQILSDITNKDPQLITTWQQVTVIQKAIKELQDSLQQLDSSLISDTNNPISEIQTILNKMHTTVTKLLQATQEQPFNELSENIENIDKSIENMNSNINKMIEGLANLEDSALLEINPKNISEAMTQYTTFLLEIKPADINTQKRKVILDNMYVMFLLKEATEREADQQLRIISNEKNRMLFWRSGKEQEINKQKDAIQQSVAQNLNTLYSEFKNENNQTLSTLFESNKQVLITIDQQTQQSNQESLAKRALKDLIHHTAQNLISSTDTEILTSRALLYGVLKPDQLANADKLASFSEISRFEQEDQYLNLINSLA